MEQPPDSSPSSFELWRAAQARVAELQRNLAMLQNPASARHVPHSEESLHELLSEARREADKWLTTCLRDTRRIRNAYRSLGGQANGFEVSSR